MKIYQASGEGTVEVENIEPSEGSKVKIKVKHVMPTASDLNFFNGSVKREYQRRPSRIRIEERYEGYPQSLRG